MKGGTFGGAKLPLQNDNTNNQGFPPVITDAGNIYIFKCVTNKRTDMKKRATYVEKYTWGKPQAITLSMREAYLLA